MMQPDDPIAITLLVTTERERLHIPYFIGGSLAAVVYGEYRATRDADLVAQLRLEHVAPLVQALEAQFFVHAADLRTTIQHAQQPLPDPAYRASVNLIHHATGFKVDIFVGTGRPFEQTQFRRRVYEVVAREPERGAYLATAEDTILAKLDWYRLGGEVSNQQWRDIQAVLRVQGELLDRPYLHTRAAELDLTGLLQRALQEAGLDSVR